MIVLSPECTNVLPCEKSLWLYSLKVSFVHITITNYKYKYICMYILFSWPTSDTSIKKTGQRRVGRHILRMLCFKSSCFDLNRFLEIN